MRRLLKIVIEYDGTRYAGFQRQKNGVTIQSELERALRECLKAETRVVAAGRTDAGVHATGQVCTFETTNPIPAEKIPLALNRLLPDAIVVRSGNDVHGDFHPRFSATSRVYRYTIDNRPIRSALTRHYAHHVSRPLDVEAMQRAANHLIGTHDFASFAASGSETASTVRDMFRVECKRHGHAVTVTLEANAFLYQMVRNIIGTLIEVGLAQREPDEMIAILEARNRKAAGPTAPANGLCLMKVKYDKLLPRSRRRVKI